MSLYTGDDLFTTGAVEAATPFTGPLLVHTSGSAVLAVCATDLELEVSASGGELRVLGYGPNSGLRGRPDKQMFDVSGDATVVIQELTIVDLDGDRSSYGVIDCNRGDRMVLNNVEIVDPVATNNSHVIGGYACDVELNNVEIRGFVSDTGAALAVYEFADMVVRDSRIRDGVSGGPVGAVVTGSFTMERTLFEDNQGTTVLEFRDEQSSFTCLGDVGVETGFLRNDAAVLGFPTPSTVSPPPVGVLMERCDFGTGPDINTFTVRWTDGDTLAGDLLGNDWNESYDGR